MPAWPAPRPPLPPPPRLRPALDGAAVPPRGGGSTGAGRCTWWLQVRAYVVSAFKHLKNFRQLLLQLLDRPVVNHGVRRTLRLFLLGELAGATLGQRLVPAASRPLGAQLLVGHHRDRGVERSLHPGLEQEWYLHHCRPRRRRAGLERGPPAGHPLTHPRPQQLLEPGPILRR